MRLNINLWVGALLVFASGNVPALDLDVRSNRSNILDFSLAIEHSRLELKHDADIIKSNLERIGIISFDVPSSGPHFGLLLGYAFSDFSNNDIYPTIGMDGYYIGVAVRGIVFKVERFSLGVAGHYLYQNIRGNEEQRDASLSWNEFAARAVAELQVTDSLRCFAGAVTGLVDATYRETGLKNFTDDLDNNNNSGYLAGLRYNLNRLESLSVKYHNAVTEGVVLRFRRLF